MNPTEQAMRSVVEETFASLAFMFPVEPDTGAAAPQEPTVWAAVDFSGPFRGSLLLSASSGMLEPLATNMLGLDEGISPSQEQKQDAFRELINVICGNLLPVIASPREVFDVHEPRWLAGSDDAPAAGGLKELGVVEVELDAGHVRLALFTQSPSAATSASPREAHV